MKLKTILLYAIAVLLGYIAMVILITLVQETIFGGVSYTHSGFLTLALAGIGTFISAVAGGALAGYLIRFRNLIPHFIMSTMVVIETTYLITNSKTIDPLWFDVMAASSLIIGILVGGYYGKRMLSKNSTRGTSVEIS